MKTVLRASLILLPAFALSGCELAKTFDKEQAKDEVCIIHDYLPMCKQADDHRPSGWKLPGASK